MPSGCLSSRRLSQTPLQLAYCSSRHFACLADNPIFQTLKADAPPKRDVRFNKEEIAWFPPSYFRVNSCVSWATEKREDGIYFKYLSNQATVRSRRSIWFSGLRYMWPSPG